MRDLKTTNVMVEGEEYELRFKSLIAGQVKIYYVFHKGEKMLHVPRTLHAKLRGKLFENLSNRPLDEYVKEVTQELGA